MNKNLEYVDKRYWYSDMPLADKYIILTKYFLADAT